MQQYNIPVLLSNVFEWYDFTVYAFLGVPLGMIFFRGENINAAIISSYSVVAVSFLLRPLGALFFGWLADRRGVTASLKYTTLLMTVSASLIALLPGSSAAGLLSPVLLIFLRCIQGFAAGGELPSLASWTQENVPEGKYRHVLFTLPNAGGMAGVLLASFTVFILYECFSEDEVLLWAWRIPFLLGIPVVYFLLIVRLNLPELKKKITAGSVNGKKITYKSIIRMSAVMSFLQVSFYILFIWLSVYLENYLQMEHSFVKAVNLISLAGLALTTIISGSLCSRLRPDRMVFASALGCTLFTCPLFLMINTKSVALICLAMAAFVFMTGLIQRSYMYLLSTSLSGKNKNKIISMIYIMPAVLSGGTAGYLCSHFVLVCKQPDFPELYLMTFSLIVTLLYIAFKWYKEPST